MEKENVIVMCAEDTYSDLFWNEDGAGIGDYDSFFIGNEEYSTSSRRTKGSMTTLPTYYGLQVHVS